MPSWDLFLALFFVVGIGYGLVLQREKAVTTLFATYVALIVAQTWAEPLAAFLNGNKAILNVYVSGKVSPFQITAGLFVLFIVLIAQKSGLKTSKAGISSFEILLYSFFSTGLIISTVLSFLPANQLTDILRQSQIARYLITYRTAFILLPPVVTIALGIRRGE